MLDRKQTITDETDPADPRMIASYLYIGHNRVLQRDYGNDTRMTYAYDGTFIRPDDFGVRQVIGTTRTFDPSGPKPTHRAPGPGGLAKFDTAKGLDSAETREEAEQPDPVRCADTSATAASDRPHGKSINPFATACGQNNASGAVPHTTSSPWCGRSGAASARGAVQASSAVSLLASAMRRMGCCWCHDLGPGKAWPVDSRTYGPGNSCVRTVQPAREWVFPWASGVWARY